MSEERATYAYTPEQHPLGYMPLPEVYASLDAVLAFARNPASPAASAGTDFLLRWYRLGVVPARDDIDQAKAAMAGNLDALASAFRASLQAFVDGLAEHPSPLPGSPFGDYFHDLVDLAAGGSHGS